MVNSSNNKSNSRNQGSKNTNAADILFSEIKDWITQNKNPNWSIKKEYKKELVEKSSKDLLDVQKKANAEWNADVVKLIAEVLKIQTDNLQKKNKENEKNKANLEKEKQKQSDLAEQLKKQLLWANDSINDLKSELDKKEKEMKEKEKENTKKLDDLLKANKQDKKEADKLKKELADLKKAKEELRAEMKKLQEENQSYKDAENIPWYQDDVKNEKGEVIWKTGDKIDKLDTKWIDGKLFPVRTEWWRSRLSLWEISVVRNLRTRRRINKTINMFNKIWDDPAKWLKYFLAKSYLTKWWKIWMALQRVKNRWSIDNKTQLDSIFDQQKKAFIDDLKEKLGKNWLSEKDANSIKQIESRLNYYHKRYKNDFIKLR